MGNGRQDVIGVNADRRESDLDVMPNDVLALWRGNSNPGSQQASGEEVQKQAKPYGLWWYVMLLVLAAAVAESLLASQYLGRLREEP
jgi:hypothetical protein